MSNIFTSLTDTESIAFLTHKMHHAQKAINFFPWAKKVLGFDSKYKSLPIKWMFFRFDPCNKCYGLKSAPSQPIGEFGRTKPCPQKIRPAVSILRARLQIHQLALTEMLKVENPCWWFGKLPPLPNPPKGLNNHPSMARYKCCGKCCCKNSRPWSVSFTQPAMPPGKHGWFSWVENVVQTKVLVW